MTVITAMTVLGGFLTLWVLWDLFAGSVYLINFDRPHKRSEEPFPYWFAILLWSAIAASCFIYPTWGMT